MIRFIQDEPDGLICISSEGIEFLNSQLPGESKLEDIDLVGIKPTFGSKHTLTFKYP